MISFDTLQLSEDRKTMTITVSIEDTTANPTYYISGIYVEYYKFRNTSWAPSDHAYEAYSASTTTYAPVTVTIDAEELHVPTPTPGSFADGLYYVIVLCKDTEDSEELTSDVAAILDWQAVYDIGMNAVAQLNKNCEKGRCDIPANFEQFILVWHSLELALDAQDVDMIDRLWSRFISYGSVNNGSTCNCQ